MEALAKCVHKKMNYKTPLDLKRLRKIDEKLNVKIKKMSPSKSPRFQNLKENFKKQEDKPNPTTLTYNSGILDFKLVKNITKDCYEQIRKRGYIPRTIAGRGQYGGAYINCVKITSKKMDCSYILKVQPATDEYFNEIRILNILKGFRHAVQMKDHWICGGNWGFIVMERLEKCKKEITRTQVFRMAQKMKDEFSVLHVDTHKGNIMCNKFGHLVFIDFGWAAIPDNNYKNHPLVKNSYFKKIPTYKLLEKVQKLNITKNFRDRN